MTNLLDIFVNLMTIDSEKYFLCELEQFKQLADVIAHINIPLRTRCVSGALLGGPIN